MAAREHISRPGMVEVQSASSFHKLVHSQVITMKTLKEDTDYGGSAFMSRIHFTADYF